MLDVDQARPKSAIYTPKRDDEHPLHFHIGVPPPGTLTYHFISNTQKALIMDSFCLMFDQTLFSCFNSHQNFYAKIITVDENV